LNSIPSASTIWCNAYGAENVESPGNTGIPDHERFTGDPWVSCQVFDSQCLKINLMPFGSHSVYCIQFHLVMCTKYRRKVLQGEIDERLKYWVRAVFAHFGLDLIQQETDQDLG
jgi:hypothetical protein